YIGTSADGMSAMPNGGDGISAPASVTYAPLTIGNGTVAGGNVISGNGGNGVRTCRSAALSANIIGLAEDGSTARGNSLNGVSIEGSVSVLGNGGAPTRNVISANGRDGVRVSGATGPGNRSTIRDNYIGTDATGMLARGNGSNG